MDSSGKEVVVVRTGRLYEADMAAEALEQAGLPFYRREENITGIQLAMPAMPAQAPGMMFLVIVAEESAGQARAIIEELPISQSTEPEFWANHPAPHAKKIYRHYAIVILILTAVIFLIQMLRAISSMK